MTKEESQLLKENNILLKQILTLLQQSTNQQYLKQFAVDFFANKAANNF